MERVRLGLDSVGISQFSKTGLVRGEGGLSRRVPDRHVRGHG